MTWHRFHFLPPPEHNKATPDDNTAAHPPGLPSSHSCAFFQELLLFARASGNLCLSFWEKPSNITFCYHT